MQFEATESERERGEFQAYRLAEITSSIRVNGFAVVSNLISHETCELLGDAIINDAQRVLALGKPTRHEQVTAAGHLQLGLRRYAPFVRADLVANPLIESVVAGMLGNDAWLGFYNGNVNCPGSAVQPLHFDRPYTWKTPGAAKAGGVDWPPPTTTLSCSVALTEITAATGATEIYPGTHLETAVAGWKHGERPANHPELVAKWEPSARMEIPRGGVCFRDPRMWHRGVSNTSGVVRPMIALTYHASMAKHWRGLVNHDMRGEDLQRCEADPTLKLMDDGTLGDGQLVFDVSSQPAFEEEPEREVRRNVRFVEAPYVVNHFLDAHNVGGARVAENEPIAP